MQARPFGEWKDLPVEQLISIFGSSGYVLYKALDFANDHGYRYIKIISYEFDNFNQKAAGCCDADSLPGRFFELVDENSTISVLCFDRAPDDKYIIDVKKHQDFIYRVEEALEDLYERDFPM